MNLNELSNKAFYNLLVTFDDTAWESDKYEMDKNRFLEHTETNIRSKFYSLDDNAIKYILEMPCLFLYELGRKNHGYIGYITDIKVRTKNIGIKFKKDHKILIDDIQKLSFELDINGSSRNLTELQRTHWAIKNVDLLTELQEYDNNLFPTSIKPKVFVSYSWESIKTQNKVKHLVAQLKKDGVDVIYDKESLKLGNDIPFFMEKISNDSTIKKVLVICDESYKRKADSRKRGVGTETELIIPDVYSKPLQRKIIPVFFEKNENNEMFVPTFLKNKRGVDLTLGNEQNNYFELLEDILS